jgi:hypothetical protein
MSYISVDFDESYRCADVVESLARGLYELTSDGPGELCHAMEVYSRKLFGLSADLYNATRDYEYEDARGFGKEFHEHPRNPAGEDCSDIKTLLTHISGKLDQCAEDIPGEISVRSNLYFRIKDAAKEARLLIKETD